MSYAKRPDCDLEDVLTEAERASLGGFTSRAFRALGHLREAWCVADTSNRLAIESAIRALMRGHSFADQPKIVAKILAHGLGLGPELLKSVGLEP